MSISDEDLEAFAARIRPHFEPELRDDAQELAMILASSVGAEVKTLRPETTLAQLLDIIKQAEGSSSLDQVEWTFFLEGEFGMDISDRLAAQPERTTFRDLVLEKVRARRAA